MPVAPAARSAEPKPVAGGKKHVSMFEQHWSLNNPILVYYSDNDAVEYIAGGGESIYHTATIRSNLPLEVVGFRQAFGLTIESLGEKGYIALGMCTSAYSTSSLPGWHQGSVGFHVDEGFILDHLEYNGQKRLNMSYACAVGDVLSCSLHEHPQESEKVVIVFGINGTEIYRVTTKLPVDGFFAVAGMMSLGEQVRLHADVAQLPKVVCEMAVFRSLDLAESATSPNQDFPPSSLSRSVHMSPALPIASPVRSSEPESGTTPNGDTGRAGMGITQSKASCSQFSVQQNLTCVKLPPHFASCSFQYEGDTDHVGCAVLRSCLSPKLGYFELVLHEFSFDAVLRLGAVGSSYDCSSTLPGEREDSFAYQPSLGVWENGHVVVKTQALVSPGDVIGIEFDQESLKQSERLDGSLRDPICATPVRIYGNNNLICETTCHIPVGRMSFAVGVAGGRAKFTVMQSFGLARRTYYARHSLPRGHLNLKVKEVGESFPWSYIHNATLSNGCVVNVTDASQMVVLCSERFVTPCCFYFEVKCVDLRSLCLSLLPRTGSPDSGYSFLPQLGELRRGSQAVQVLAINLTNLEEEESVNIGMGVDFLFPDTRTADVFVTFNNVEVGRIHANTNENLYPCIRLYPPACTAMMVARFPVKWPPKGYNGVGMCRSSKFITSKVDRIFQYAGKGGQEEMGLVQSATPLSPSRPYYEITVISPGDEGYVGVGLAHMSYPLQWQPGWGPGSIGLHIDDGKLFHGPKQTSHIICPTAYKSAVIGCGMVFPPDETSGVGEVYFTVNGRLVSRVLSFFPLPGYYPTVGLNSVGATVEFVQPSRVPPGLQLAPFACCWQDVGRDSPLTSLRSVAPNLLADWKADNKVVLKPLSYHLSRFSYTPSKGDYFVVSPTVPANAPPVIVGYVISSTSSSADTSHAYSFLVDTSRGTVWYDGQEMMTKIPSISCEGSDVGLGFHQGKMESLFIVTVSHQLVFCLPIRKPSFSYHRVIQSSCDTDVSVSIDCSSQWPPLTPAGKGWSIAKNLVCYRGCNLTAPESASASLSFAQAARPLIPSLGQYFEIAVVAGKKRKFYMGLASQGFAVEMGDAKCTPTESPVSNPSRGKLIYPKGMDFISLNSQGQIRSKWTLQHKTDPLPCIGLGDTVGCGITQDSSSSQRIVFFTHNSHIVAYGLLPTSQLMYPWLALPYLSDTVLQVNLSAVFGWKVPRKMWRLLVGVSPLSSNTFQCCSSAESLEGVLQASTPLSPQHNFFQVEILTCESKPVISVGAATELYNPIESVHDSCLSVLYSSGGYLSTNGTVTGQSHSFTFGDVIGCLVHFTDNSRTPTAVDLFKNGALIGHSSAPEFIHRAEVPMYPTVCLHHADQVRITHIGLHKTLSEVIAIEARNRDEWSSIPKNFRSNHSTLMCVESSSQPLISQALMPIAPVNNSTSVSDIPDQISYFEVELLSILGEKQIAIGIATENHCFDPSFNTCDVAIAFACAQGVLTICTQSKEPQVAIFSPAVQKGDIFGLGFHSLLPSSSSDFSELCVYFVRNGIYIGHCTVQVPSASASLYPTVSLCHQGDAVKLDLAATPSCNTSGNHHTWRVLIRTQSLSAPSHDFLKFSCPVRLRGGLAVARVPFSKDCVYFEVELLPRGKQSLVAVGTVPAVYRLDRYPGRESLSFGYQSNGRVYKEHGTGNLVGPSRMSRGDRLGCGLDLSSRNGPCVVYFTYNRVRMAQFVIAEPTEPLYPAIGLFYHDQVRVKFYGQDSLQPLHLHQPPSVSLKRIHHVLYLEPMFRYSGADTSSPLQTERSIGVVQFSLPPATFAGQHILTVCLRELDSSDTVLIGLADESYPSSVYIGQLVSSVGYNITSGLVTVALDRGEKYDLHCAPSNENDVVGVALVYATPPRIVYTLNGEAMCSIPCTLSTWSGLLPAINMVSPKDTAKLCCYWAPLKHSGVQMNDLSIS